MAKLDKTLGIKGTGTFSCDFCDRKEVIMLSDEDEIEDLKLMGWGKLDAKHVCGECLTKQSEE